MSEAASSNSESEGASTWSTAKPRSAKEVTAAKLIKSVVCSALCKIDQGASVVVTYQCIPCFWLTFSSSDVNLISLFCGLEGKFLSQKCLQ